MLLLSIIFIAGTFKLFADDLGKTSSIEQGGLGDESWSVESRVDRFFYFTHGTTVWGHEFGFIKTPGDCDEDMFWLTFSSSDEKVKNFEGQNVGILLNVDGKDFKIKLPILNTGIIGITSVMTFTNLYPDKLLMEALLNGRYVTVRIVEPKDLENLLDIKEDKFGLQGLIKSREKAGTVCKGK